MLLGIRYEFQCMSRSDGCRQMPVIIPGTKYMAFIKNVRAVLVESGEARQYANGDGGRFVTLLQKDDQLITAWLPKDVEESYGHPLDVMDVQGYDEADALSFQIAMREWEGRTKRKIVAIGE